MPVGRPGRILLALGAVGVAAGGVAAVAFGRDSGAVVVQEVGPNPDTQRWADDPAAFDEYLRTHPVEPMMGETRTTG